MLFLGYRNNPPVQREDEIEKDKEVRRPLQ